MTDNSIPAAQYLRMSTDHQQYAAERSFSIVKTYKSSCQSCFQFLHGLVHNLYQLPYPLRVGCGIERCSTSLIDKKQGSCVEVLTTNDGSAAISLIWLHPHAPLGPVILV